MGLWQVYGNHFPGVSEIHGSVEIKGIMLMCLVVVLQSHDCVQPMSYSQMGLIRVMKHAQIYNYHWKWNRWDVFLLHFQHHGILLCRKIKICGTIYIGIHLCSMCGYYRTIYDWFFYWFSAKTKKTKPTGGQMPLTGM